MKLTRPQQAALATIQRLTCVRSGDSETITDKTLDDLEDKGLVEYDEATGWWSITQAGQAAVMHP